MHISAIVTILVSTVRCANILGVFMFPSISHQIVYQQIWRELSLRGHQVTVVTPDPLNDHTLTNLTEISVRFVYDELEEHIVQEILSKDLNKRELTKNLHKIANIVLERELNSTQFKELIWDQNKQFDLILIEFTHPVMYALTDRFKAPMIVVFPSDMYGYMYEALGCLTLPTLYPEGNLNFPPGKLTLWQKFENIYFSLWTKYYSYNTIIPGAHKMAKKYFGNKVPYIGDLQKNISMLLVNTNRVIHPSRPNVPAAIEIGPLDIKPPQALPKDLQKVLDEATEGVIYFSLGSNVKSIRLETNLRRVILQALSELPYMVLLKWESDYLPGKPSNVVTREWLPQTDVLAHPNIKAFVTQGGAISIEEAITRGVPIVGIPFIADQPRNVDRIVELGIGEKIDPKSLTPTTLKNVIIKVAQSKLYRNRVKEAHSVIFDKPMTGLESAVWWSEYVIRHKGAKHLRSLSADVSWFEYLLLDVTMISISITLAVYMGCKLHTVLKKLF